MANFAIFDMNRLTAKLMGPALVVAGTLMGINVALGGEGYNGQHRDQFEEALIRSTITHVAPASDRNISREAQEEFFNQFLRDHGFMEIDGKGGIYDSQGNRVEYPTLTEMIDSYDPT